MVKTQDTFILLHAHKCQPKLTQKDFFENAKLFVIIIPLTYLLFCIGQKINYDSPIGE